MNNHKKRGKKTPPGNMVETAIKNAQFARELQDEYGGAHIRKLSSGVFRGDGTPKSRSPSNGNGSRGEVVRLRDIAEKSPSIGTSINGEPDDENYTIITRYLFKKLRACILIPENAEIVEVPEHPEFLAHYRVRFGDGFCFFVRKFFDNLKPGDFIEGIVRIEVKKVEKPNQKIRTGYYPHLSFVESSNEDRAIFFVEFNSEKRYVPKGSIDFTPASGRKRTILHLTKIEPGITIKRK